MTEPLTEITALIHAAAGGDAASRDRLLALIYGDLLRLARSHLARERTYTHLDAPALVHEAYLRFADHMPPDAASRQVFFKYASRAMRSVIIDHVRQRGAHKRGQGQAEVTLVTGIDDAVWPQGHACTDERAEQLERALQRLERIDAGLHDIVQLRCYGGLSVEQVAELTGVSPATVKRRWSHAITILRSSLSGD